jgi:DNA-binding NarL/FixJ family response regulator
MRKRKVLVIGSATLFGHGVGGLLDSRRNGLQIEQVPTVEAAIETAPRFRPDVVVFCVERDDLRDEEGFKRLRLMEVYPTRIVRCTLDANHLTVYDTTRIKDATVEDLIDAVLRSSSDDQTVNRREGTGGGCQ